MKRALLLAVAMATVDGALAQGTVVFNNRIPGILVTHVYRQQWWGGRIIGNGPNDTPAGTTDWSIYRLVEGSGFSAAILAAPGSSAPESTLTFGPNPTITSFRTGGAAGCVAGLIATLNQLPKDAAVATLQLFVWENEGGTVNDPLAAMSAFRSGSGLVWAAGWSNPFTLSQIGGDWNTPPVLSGLQSFSLYEIPEPSPVVMMITLSAIALCVRNRSPFRARGTGSHLVYH